MTARFLIPLAGLAALSLLQAAPTPGPRMFSDVGSAIQYAKENNQLIIFALLDAKSETSQAVVKMLNDNSLSLEKKEFVIVNCDSSNSNDTALFTSRFKQDASKAPVVVITDPAGQLLASQAGQSKFNDYVGVIHTSLVKAGFREDESEAPLISAEMGGDELVSGGSKIFGVTLDDVKMKNVALTKMREWKRKTGESFTAELIKGEGSTGLFRMEDGSEKNVSFNDLDAETIEFLKTVLTQGEPEDGDS